MIYYIASLIILCCTLSNVYAAVSDTCTKHHCLAIVNAGSSGSRAYIYSYDLDKTNTPIHINKLWGHTINPGISTIEHQPQAVFSYLDKLFAKMPRPHINVYFYATAGMRLLSQKDNEDTYALIKKWFMAHHRWNLVEARTISGEEEGLYTWLAANYAVHRFEENKPLIAVIDIGGGSTQISIPVQKDKKMIQKTPNVHSFILYGRKMNIHSFSFLGLGQNEFTKHFNAEPFCFAKNYILDSGARGTGNIAECIHLMSQRLNRYFVLEAVKKRVAQYTHGEWYILGGIVKMLQGDVFLIKNKVTSSKVLRLAKKEVCQPEWTSLEKKYKEEKLVSTYCKLSSYWYSLLVKGYKLPKEQAVYFFADSALPDWSIGVVLANYKQ